MRQWTYGHAIYGHGRITPDENMKDVSPAPSWEYFLNEAGAKGWELCATLPVEYDRDALALVFKRQSV